MAGSSRMRFSWVGLGLLAWTCVAAADEGPAARALPGLAAVTCELVDCPNAGKSQSPIALEPVQGSPLLPPVARYGARTALVLLNDGHGLRADLPAADLLDPGRTNLLQVDGGSYQLVEFHFHRPGEHLWPDNVRPAMELHLVHADAVGAAAALGVPIVVRSGVPDNPFIAQLWAQIPAGAGERRSLPTFFDLAGFIEPTLRAASFRYPGSLTTPPCSEGLRWNLTGLTTALVISTAQDQHYANAFPHPYCRPLQDRNGRVPLRIAP